jgi:sugar O-acyltransferase (sialic acid O-acetyltransferase NeuD family)
MSKEYKELYIIGAGGFGREIADTVLEINAIHETYHIAGFIDDEKAGELVNGVSVLGGVEYLRDRNIPGKAYAVICIADSSVRESIVLKLNGLVTWENIIHPSAIIKKSASLGKGNAIQSFTTISSNAVIGDHCIINCNCVVGHDAVLEDFVSLMPQCGVMGFCRLESRTYLGVGAKLIPGVTIGRDAIIGAGATVIKDVEPESTHVGNPARRIV